jgi:biopolymer transport protein ExbD
MAATQSGAYHDDDDAPMIVDINVTPLVDIMLVLLIIFMVTATFIVQPGLPVQLPKAATGEETGTSTLEIQVAKDGALSMNGARVSEEDLRQSLVAAAAQKPDLQAIIAADREVAHGDVVHLMDLMRQSGVHKFALSVERAAQ